MRLRARRALLFAIAATGGLATLGVELCGARLLGPVFGASNLVWANLIGLILLFLSVGCVVGGRAADRSPCAARLFTLAVAAGFLIGLVPLGAPFVLRWAAGAAAQVDGGVVLGSFVAIVALFAVPVTLLGCLSPYALRLVLLDVEHAGRAAGLLSGLSTLGSLVGTFLPVLYLIPTIGTARTFLAISSIVMLMGLVGLALESWPRAAALACLPALIALLTWLRPPTLARVSKSDVVVIHEAESRYNHIQIAELSRARGALPAGTRMLLLNEAQGVHSIWPAAAASRDPWRLFLVAPFFNAPPHPVSQVRRVAIIGLAAGTLAAHYRAALGKDIQIDGIEIDPEIVHLARQHFELDSLDVNAIVDDGRLALRRLPRQYDMIALDAYRPPYIPWHLATAEFFAELRSHMGPTGVVAANVVYGLDAESRVPTLVDRIASSMRAGFPSVYAVDLPGSFNTLLVASAAPTSIDNLRRNFTALSSDAPERLRSILEIAIAHARVPDTSATPFTDDTTDLEAMVNEMLLRSKYGETVALE